MAARNRGRHEQPYRLRAVLLFMKLSGRCGAGDYCFRQVAPRRPWIHVGVFHNRRALRHMTVNSSPRSETRLNSESVALFPSSILNAGLLLTVGFIYL